ncbi:hypothetical protein B0H11DRAFT_2022222 [Mycena galericulata]|nr:hypothetical protein B0H11DRAFT_2022222 [Mycena galericulata]
MGAAARPFRRKGIDRRLFELPADRSQDIDEFRTSILPRMFKHSNFASFVRQLNKYGFHKVKNIDDQENTWTFRHPDFHADHREALDNIKRKVPGQRKSSVSRAAAVPLPSSSSTHAHPQPVASGSASGSSDLSHISDDALKTEVASMRTQLASLGTLVNEVLSHVRVLERSHQEVLVEMVAFQRGLAQQDKLMASLLQYILRENNGKIPGSDTLDLGSNPFLGQTQDFPQVSLPGSSSDASSTGSLLDSGVGAGGSGSRMNTLARIEEVQAQQVPSERDQMASQQQMESLNSEEYEEAVLPTTAPMAVDVSPSPSSDGWSGRGLEVEHLMSPGIAGVTGWPFDYTSLSSSSGSSGSRPLTPSLRTWTVPPRILVVEDDAISRKLSSKFLQLFGCKIDVAMDGVDAVSKMALQKYDLVLMDIFMPKLDGMSATSMIREFDQQTPIISMTSNARPTEVMSYYSSGMNDILAKPFTKGVLLDMLKKHLMHLRQKISSISNNPSPLVGISPSGDVGFEGALQGVASSAANLLDFGFGSPDAGDGNSLIPGFGLTNDQYNAMLAGMMVDGEFNLKRGRDVNEEDVDADAPERKRANLRE